MTFPRITQAPVVTVSGGIDKPRLTQFSIITVLKENTPIRISQIAIITVAANSRRTVQLNPILKLGCWTPCGWMLKDRSFFQ